MVYLTECDPADYAPGTMIDVEIVGHREYDLIAQPLGCVTVMGRT
jgi:hypothetical protein